MDVTVDPIAALRSDGYSKKVANERGMAQGSLSGYPS
jgi:hypothetical protein